MRIGGGGERCGFECRMKERSKMEDNVWDLLEGEKRTEDGMENV